MRSFLGGREGSEFNYGYEKMGGGVQDVRVHGSLWDGEQNSRYIGAKKNRVTGT